MKHLNNARLLVGVFYLAILSACSTPQTSLLLQQRPSTLPPHLELTEVAYFPQEENQCGPASLAMVLATAGLPIQPEQLKDELYIPDRKGSLQVEMLAAARRQGMLAYQLEPHLEYVLNEVAAGNPVIVLENLSLQWFPMWHYAVVIGYDLDKQEIILRSGAERRDVMTLSTFEHTWSRSQYWAMLALPLSRIPQTATPGNYIQSLQALGHSRPQASLQPAFEAALQRWPDDLAVQIAAGNEAYNRNDFANAQRIFRIATSSHPDSAAAFNNLAQTLSDMGQYEEALRIIHQAVQIGGPLKSIIVATQAEIERKKRAAEAADVK